MSEVVSKKSFFQKMKEKRDKPKSKARIIVEWVLFGIFGALFALVLAGNISAMVNSKKNYNEAIRFGVGSFIVLTNSMEPEYPVKSSIITYQEDVDKVYSRFISSPDTPIDITFKNVYCGFSFIPDNEEFKHGECIVTDRVMTHRIREIHVDESKSVGEGKYIFVTSGINVNGESSKKGQYQVFTEKQYLGVVKYKSIFLGKVFGFVSSPYGLIVLLLIPAAYLIITSGIDISKALKEEESTPKVANPDNKIDSLSEKDKERLKKELLEEMINKKKGENKDAQD